jgi:FSR family fosmidomycin resistance protein-like MFS transporter
VTIPQAALAVAVWTGVGLLGDALLLPLLERVPGVRYLRVSAALTALAFAAFLLVPGVVPKLALAAALGLLNSGWYAILKAGLYASMPDRSATVMTVDNVGGLVGSVVPLGVGLVAQQVGLGDAMWLLLVSPIALFVGLPRR